MDYFVLRFDHSYRKEDFRALSKLAGKTTRKWSSRIIYVFGFAVGLFAFLSGILMLRSLIHISRSRWPPLPHLTATGSARAA